MSKSNNKEFSDKLTNKIEKWSDEECLEHFALFLNRIEIASQPVQNSETGLITHQMLVIQCGEKAVASMPLAFEWPMQPANLPEDAEVAIN